MAPTILIVDDEPHMLRVIELSLRKGGFQLRPCRDGRQAVSLAVSERPEAIVMDVQMPVLDGLGALRELRRRPETADIPVVLLTASGQTPAWNPEDPPGADVFLTKPFSPAQLLSEVRRLVARTSAANPPSPAAP